jgi:hypothetical protein
MKAWVFHVLQVRLLHKEEFTTADLQQLNNLTEKWKSMMVKQFPNCEFNYPNFETEDHWVIYVH